MGIFSNQLESDIERATSDTLVAGSEDIETSLAVCDAIRSKQVSSKETINLFKRRLCHKNSNVHLLTLQLMDFCAKNGGSHFLTELSSPSFTQFLHEYIKSPQCHFQVREKGLICIQLWGLGFASKPELQSMVKLYEALKSEGFSFPKEPDISSDFFESQTPPDWGDSDVCMRCRSSFTLTNRKHHCRQCGETYCNSCSSNTKPLPHLGIAKPVRVCDGCYERSSKSLSRIIQRHSSSQHEDPELSLAIQLSLQEEFSRLHEPDDDPQLAVAIAASLKDTMNLNTSPITQSSNLTSSERFLVQQFCDMVQHASYSSGQATSELKSLYTQVYPYQAKLQRDLDSFQLELNKWSSLYSSYMTALYQYENPPVASVQVNNNPTHEQYHYSQPVQFIPSIQSHVYNQSQIDQPIHHSQQSQPIQSNQSQQQSQPDEDQPLIQF